MAWEIPAFLRGVAVAVMLGNLPSGTPAMAETAKPVVLQVIKQEFPGKPRNIHSIHVPLLKLGDRLIEQPLLLDTGSAGMSVDCDVILPKEMCSPEGIKIDYAISMDGILVTPEKIVAHYGGSIAYGNLARARIAIGDTEASVVTEQPINFMIRTKVVRRSDGKIVGGKLWPKGILGISPIGAIDEKGTIFSPLNAVAVPEGLHRGYSLGDLGTDWVACANEDKTCPTVPALSVGVDPADRAAWKFTRIRRDDEGYNFPTIIACAVVQERKPICKPTLFDSGNSNIVVAGVKSKPLKKGQDAFFATLGRWEFQTTYSNEVIFDEMLRHHVVGVRFFERNRLLFDLDTGAMALRIKSE